MDVLFVCATPIEAGELLDEVLVTGVGKTAAACALARRLAVEPWPHLVVSFGVCGVHGAESGLDIGALCFVDSDRFADEGVATEGEFLTLADLGLGTDPVYEMDVRLTHTFAAVLGGCPTVAGSTVSTCSGNDEDARARATRTGARIETMEGAALAHVCQAFDVPMVQLRAISNRTGDRDRAGWDLELACANVQDAVRRLREEAGDA